MASDSSQGAMVVFWEGKWCDAKDICRRWVLAAGEAGPEKTSGWPAVTVIQVWGDEGQPGRNRGGGKESIEPKDTEKKYHSKYGLQSTDVEFVGKFKM
jgi:hypothetical protein